MGKSGRHSSPPHPNSQADPAAASSEPTSSEEPAPKKKRANYDVPGPAKDRLDAAVAAWMDGKASEELSQNQYAKSLQIPQSTFSKHLQFYKAQQADPTLKKIGKTGRAAMERRRVVPYEKQEFIVDAVVRADRSGEGMAIKDIFDLMQTLCPALTRVQCKGAFKKFRKYPEFKDRLVGAIKITTQSKSSRSNKVETKFSGDDEAEAEGWSESEGGGATLGRHSQDEINELTPNEGVLDADNVRAGLVRDETIEALLVRHKEAARALAGYEAGGDFEGGCFEHRAKKRRVELLEADLEKLME